MELHTEPGIALDHEDELAVTQVIARLRRVGAAREHIDLSVRDPTDDELLDQFWRRRSGSGHC
jgi:hypothetical protein